MHKYFIIAGLLTCTAAFSQKKAPENWMLLDPRTDKVYGAGVENAYEKLKGRTAKTVIVAVIDSGIDTDHEDLKDIIWTNLNEIPDNGIDDDKNGYVDDIHGWSFLGGKGGDINQEASELARIYHKLDKKYAGRDTTKWESVAEYDEYVKYKKIKADFLKEQSDDQKQLVGVKYMSDFIDNVKVQNNGTFNKTGLNNYIPKDKIDGRLKKFTKFALTMGMAPEELENELKMGKEQLENSVKYNTINTDSIRKELVGDNVDDVTERYYGCNRVQGPDAMHGTHVAGIIGAVRTNNIGIRGIADHVKIMSVRAVPNGDERDKDVANAIRYAVDNGASVINMSFGKYYSPDKKLVDEAVQYALSKDVLLVHAAGNESKDVDSALSFPNRELYSGIVAPNWLEVGANSYKQGKHLIGDFSNYGETKVDLFAPGVDIHSTVPGNKYIDESGTSMASPSAAGVAALIRSYFPELKANEVKTVMMKTVVPYKKKVIVPATPNSRKRKAKVSELCISGGFVNANNAVTELLKNNK